MTQAISVLLFASLQAGELPPIEVSASPVTSCETVSDDGIEEAVISRGQISKLNARDFQTALRQVPGITVSRYSAIGSYGGAQGGSVYIRGVGSGRPGGEIRMYSDGAPRESGVWGHPLMDSLPIDFADRLVVQKNPHPGARAGTFGAVEMQTARMEEEGSKLEANLIYGRNATFISSVSAGAKEGAVDGYGGISYKRSDGHRRHNASELSSAFGRVGVDLSDYESISFIYQRTDSSVEDPGPKWEAPPVHDRFDLSTDLYNIRFETERESVKGFSVFYVEHGDINWHKDHMTDGNRNSPAGVLDTTWLNWGTRSSYEINPADGVYLSFALDASSEGGHTRNTVYATGKVPFAYSGRFVAVSPYAGAKYKFDISKQWQLVPSAGLRYHHHSVYEDGFAPMAALKLGKKDDSIEFFANASRALHYPGIYTRAVADDFAKRTLGAEDMEYFSFGAKAAFSERTEVLVTCFRSEIEDRIDKTATGYVNSGTTRSVGVELSAHCSPVKDLSFFFGGSYANPSTGPVSRMPRWAFTFASTWKTCKYLVLHADAQYVGSMNAYSVRAEADRQDLRKIADGYLFNVRASVPLESISPFEGEVFFAVENITCEKYEYYPGYEIAGGMWYAGMRVEF